jgi:DNA-binding winged helix-turn-helix (wHTH) protein
MPSLQSYSFDGMTLDVRAMRLARGTERLVLEPKSFRLLVFLVENRDRVLSKEEIFRVVWQETAVADNALTRAIAQIRKALGDDPREPRYIATIPTVGYRFIGVLDGAGGPATEPVPEPALPARSVPRFRWPVWLVAAILIVAGIFAAFWHSRAKAAPPASSPATYNPIPLTVDPGEEVMPTFSPDGDQVAYAWSGPKADNYDIYVKTVAADSRPIRLTTDPALDYYPSWSPDRSSIAFLRIEPNGKLDLMLIPALGGPERRLGEFSLGGLTLQATSRPGRPTASGSSLPAARPTGPRSIASRSRAARRARSFLPAMASSTPLRTFHPMIRRWYISTAAWVTAAHCGLSIWTKR